MYQLAQGIQLKDDYRRSITHRSAPLIVVDQITLGLRRQAEALQMREGDSTSRFSKQPLHIVYKFE
jgi:hypothetical protein